MKECQDSTLNSLQMINSPLAVEMAQAIVEVGMIVASVDATRLCLLDSTSKGKEETESDTKNEC